MADRGAGDLALHPEDPDRLIAAFAERVPGVLRAAVVTSDGVLVAVSGRERPDDLEQLSAITAGLISLACAAAEILDNGAVTQALVTMRLGTLVIMAIDHGSSLAVLTTAAADLDMVAYEMTMLVEEAGSLFTPPARQAAGARRPGIGPVDAATGLPRRDVSGSA
jgi:predicted regulator of Ras-like GTPase activity (Roadblock/LC7/MglB family)